MSMTELEKQVRVLLARGRKVKAVKLVRETTGWGLKEAKDYVSAQERRRTASVDYGALAADELLIALEHAGHGPDPELVRACLERGEELTPGLLAMLAGGVDHDWDKDDPRWYREVHAGLLLCALREPAALPTFAGIFRNPEQDTLQEWFDIAIPIYYGLAAIPMIVNLMSRVETCDYGRNASTEMLAHIALRHPKERERVVAVLLAHLPPLGPDGLPVLTPAQRQNPPELWTWIVGALMDLRETTSQRQVTALFDADLMYEGIVGDLDDYLAEVLSDDEPSRARYTFDILKEYERQHREARRLAQHKTQSARQEALYKPLADGQTLVRGQPRIGRNDPCPCGSGKKYKRCCGEKH